MLVALMISYVILSLGVIFFLFRRPTDKANGSFVITETEDKKLFDLVLNDDVVDLLAYKRLVFDVVVQDPDTRN